jgi:membrane protein required for colicin V production
MMKIFMHFNWFDYAILGVIVLSILISFFRGFLRETISLATWVLGVIIALRFSPAVAKWLESLIDSVMLRYIIAFIALFVVVFIVGFLINLILKGALNMSGLTIFDRLLGVLFGTARGVLLVTVMLLFVSMTSYEASPWAQNSQLTVVFKPMVAWLGGYMPEQLQQISKWMGIENMPVTPPEKSD